jgi:copper(I)-binding protein
MKTVNRIWISVLVSLFLLTACDTLIPQGVGVRDAWMRPAAQGDNGAAYLLIRSAEADEILGASSDAAETVEIHESTMTGDVMEMHHSPSVPLGPREWVAFEPGGLHVMLINLKQDLKIGDDLIITLQLKNHGDLKLRVRVMDTPP